VILTVENTALRPENVDISVLSNRAEPKKKKKVDPRREIMIKERLKKKLKKLERVPPELIPIEDFITSAKSFDETRLMNWTHILYPLFSCSPHV